MTARIANEFRAHLSKAARIRAVCAATRVTHRRGRGSSDDRTGRSPSSRRRPAELASIPPDSLELLPRILERFPIGALDGALTVEHGEDLDRLGVVALGEREVAVARRPGRGPPEPRVCIATA